MILVISNEEDISADNFIEWCNYLRVPVLRINGQEGINIVNTILIDADFDIHFYIKGKNISLKQIEAVWFRRGHISHDADVQYALLSNINNKESINHYFKNEADTLNDFVLYSLRQKKSLNFPKHYNANKLITLRTAMEVGLHIPKTVVSQSANTFRQIFNGSPVITKSLQDALSVEYDQYKFCPYVHKGTVESLDIPEFFYYSKFQSMINSKYELRIFFVGTSYYACAQFRSNAGGGFGHSSSNRGVPYTLPDDVTKKLVALNEKLGLDCGSIDMLVDESDNHYFLEVNPVGQYEYMRNVCNFNFNKAILNYLTNERTV